MDMGLEIEDDGRCIHFSSTGAAVEAGVRCKLRGYIARKSDPKIKLWKDSVGFYQCLPNLPGNDWETFDPEGEGG